MKAQFFSLAPASINAELGKLGGFFLANPILSLILFFSYVLFYIYSFMNNRSADSEVYEIDLVSSGVSSILTVFFLIGLDDSNKGFNIFALDFSTPLIKVSIFLFIYGCFLILAGFTKMLPRLLVILMGNSELDLLINIIAVLMTDVKMVITGTTVFVIGVPLFGLFILQRIRRLMPGGHRL